MEAIVELRPQKLNSTTDKNGRINYKPTIRAIAIMVWLLGMSGCGAPNARAQNDGEYGRPDYLREWVAAYEINEPQRLAVIDQTDKLYQLVEDSTADSQRIGKSFGDTVEVTLRTVLNGR